MISSSVSCRSRGRRRLAAGVALLLFCTEVAVSQDAQNSEEAGKALQPLEVIGVTPLHGVGIPVDQIPSNVQGANAEEIEQSQSLDLTEFMDRYLGSVFINEAQNNPLQPDVQFRGFVASPLLGLPQGMSIYQNGVRLNEPFGETVNWALIPQSAIASVNLIPGSNPLFGRNTIGGALSIQTKNGFTHPGTRGKLTGGSFERIAAEIESGGSPNDRFGYYVTAWYVDEQGWRDFSPSRVGQLFSNFGWRGDASSLNLDLTLADTDLIGNGPAPVQLLEISRSAIFTRPDQTENELAMVDLRGSHLLTSNITLDWLAYNRNSDIDTLNGDDSDFEECEDTPGFVCEEEDGQEQLVFDQNGDPIPFTEAVDGATINRSKTRQDGYGANLQFTFGYDLAGRENQLIVGSTLDLSDIEFVSSTELGTLDETRLAVPSGFFVEDAFTALKSENDNWSLFFTDTWAPTWKLSVTLSGRYNYTEIKLRDQLGTELTGDHTYSRFNPAAGLTYGFSPSIQLYAGYGESNRAPSPVELTCADPDDPCRLPNAFLADPPLDQVVAQTTELGVRGAWRKSDWHVGLFHTWNTDDIIFISAGALTNQGFFDNVGNTRRQGVEVNLSGNSFELMEWFINYTYLDATFRENFVVPSPNNPAAIDGEIPVTKGDRIPGIPQNLLKVGAAFTVTPRFQLGFDLRYNSDQFFRGDEGNLADPLPDYTVVNLRGEFTVSRHLAFYFRIENLFDRTYESFGLFGDPSEVLGDEFDDPRFVSPGAPAAAWVGVRLAL